MLATFHMEFWSAMPSLGEMTLGEELGWGLAVVVQLGVCGLLAIASLRREPRRARVLGPAPGAWRRLVHGRWPLVAGAILLAVLNLLRL